MAILFVRQSAASAKFAGTKAASPTLPANAGANSLIILAWSHAQFDGNAGTTMAATGYSGAGVVDQTSHVASAGILYKVSAGGAETPTANATNTGTPGNSYGQAMLCEFSGCDAASPYDSADSLTAAGASTTPSVGPTPTLAQANSLIIASFGANTPGFAGATAPPSGWTAILTDLPTTDVSTVMAYKIVSTNAALSAALGTLTASAQWAGVLAVFKAAASSSSPNNSGIDSGIDLRI